MICLCLSHRRKDPPLVVFVRWPNKPPETVWDRKVTATVRGDDGVTVRDDDSAVGVGDGPNDTDRLGTAVY